MPRKDKSMFYASYLLLYNNNKMSHQEQVCKHQNHGQPAMSTINKGNNKITELRTILQRESQNS